MFRFLFAFGLLVAAGPLRAQEESLTVSNLIYTNQVLGNYVYGIEVQFVLTYQAPKGLVKDSEIAVYLIDSDGQPVASHARGTTYRDPDNRLRVVSPMGKVGSGTSTHRVFFPYYAIALLPQSYTLTVVPRVKKLFRDEIRSPKVTYSDSSTLVLKMPALRLVGLQVTDLAVEPTNLDGKSWDAPLSIGKEGAEYPDLAYRIRFEDVVLRDEVYTSPTIENVLEATWPAPTPYFHMGENDQLTLEILDRDGLKDDNRIGRRTFTPAQLADLQESDTPGSVPSFDRVTRMVVRLLTH